MSGQQSVLQLPPMIVAGSVWFAPQAILAIDFSDYTVGADNRVLTIYLVGPHQLDLVLEDADAFKAWWDQLTGQSRIQAPPPGLLHVAPALKNK